MRIAVLSDLHANLHALQAVSKDLSEQHVDEVWSLGDVVGYGGHPLDTLDWVEEHATVRLKGNHDEAVATGDVQWFNPMAAQAARLHAQLLPPPERARLFAWPETAERDMLGASVLAVHASPDDPLHEYVQPADARLGLQRWQGRARIILMGHTHRAFVAALDMERSPGPRAGASSGAGADASGPWHHAGFAESIHEPRKARAPLLLVNPGSVGQSRDGDPRASYAVLDFAARTVELRRVAYDIEAAAQAILKQGLDHLLALRLYDGR